MGWGFKRTLGKSLHLLFELSTIKYNSTNVPNSREAKNILNNYGCYCYPSRATDVGPANGYTGPPVDELDGLCKKFWQASKCLETGCDRSAPFNYEWDTNNNPVCLDTDLCAKTVCELEIDFNDRVAGLLNNGEYIQNDDDFETKSSSVYKNICSGAAHIVNPGNKDSCCGEGIDRRHFNSAIFDCCEGATVSLGTCPN